MKIKAGEIVSIRHYSGSSPFKSVVFEAEENIITIKLTKEFVIFNLFEGDPIVLTFETGGEVYNISCTLHEVNTKQAAIKLKVDNIEQMAEKRKSERYPVSLYADVRLKGYSKKETATIRNMSSDGMMICTKAKFELENELELDLYIDNSLIFLIAQVIWKINGKHNIEYGLRSLYPNLNAKNVVKRHLQNLKDEQDRFLRNLKGV
ncbi:MAG: PilZ domain-containing protein [Clostridia bacterium]|nr:PilZ domain-containing protein [Clostridia bacterium]